MNNTILIFTFDKVITESAICVYAELTRAGCSAMLIPTNPAALGAVRGAGLSYLRLPDLSSHIDDGNLNKVVQPMLERWSEAIRSLKAPGLDTTGMVNSESDIFLSLKEAFRIRGSVKEILEEHCPRATVVMHDFGILEKTVIFESAERDIPSVVIQHGFDPYERLDPTLNTGHVPWRAVHGYWDMQNYERWGYPKEKIWVTGQPRFDCIPAMIASCSKSELCKKYNLNGREKYVLLVLPLEEKDFHYRIVEGLKDLPGICVLLKAHPREFAVIPERIRAQNNVLVFADEDIRELMLIADIMIVGISTTFFEAVLMQRDIIFLEEDDSYSLEPMPAIKGNDICEVISTIKRALNDQDKLFDRPKSYVPEFIRKYNFSNDGKASQRVAENLLNLIGS